MSNFGGYQFPTPPGTPPGVPEPATWTMLIAGFAALSQAKQKAMLAQLETALGTKKAEEVRAQLDQATTIAATGGKGPTRRL